MYLAHYYDGAWHYRQFATKTRAYAFFDEQKDAGVKRIELYRLDRLFDFWDDVVCEGLFRDVIKRGLNAVYGETAAGDVHEIQTEGEGDNDHVCAD